MPATTTMSTVSVTSSPPTGSISPRSVPTTRQGFAAFFGGYPDGHYTDIDVFVSGERGVAQWTFTGTPRSGETFSYRGVDIFEFIGDRIAVKDAFRKERSHPIGF